MTEEREAEAIVDVLTEVVPDGGIMLGQRHGTAALAKAQAMEAELAPRLAQNELTANAWDAFRQAPETHASLLVNAINLVLASDAALAHRLDILLGEYRRAISHSAPVETGTLVGSDAQVNNGDVVGRDSVRITGTGNVVGDRSSATVITRQGLGEAEVDNLFRCAMERAREHPQPIQEDLEAAVETVEEETEKGEAADKSLVSKALDVMLERGPDVLEIVLEAVLNPAAAAGKTTRMLAKHARSKLEQSRRYKDEAP